MHGGFRGAELRCLCSAPFPPLMLNDFLWRSRGSSPLLRDAGKLRNWEHLQREHSCKPGDPPGGRGLRTEGEGHCWLWTGAQAPALLFQNNSRDRGVSCPWEPGQFPEESRGRGVRCERAGSQSPDLSALAPERAKPRTENQGGDAVGREGQLPSALQG